MASALPLEELQQGDHVRVPLGHNFKFDKFQEGMEGVVVENRRSCRNLMVLFDGGVQVTVGYRYLEHVPGGGGSRHGYAAAEHAQEEADPRRGHAKAPPRGDRRDITGEGRPRSERKVRNLPPMETHRGSVCDAPATARERHTREPVRPESTEVARLQSEVARLQEMCQQRDSELQTCSDQVAQLRAQLDGSTREAAQLRAELRQRDEQLAEPRGSRSSSKQRREESRRCKPDSSDAEGVRQDWASEPEPASEDAVEIQQQLKAKEEENGLLKSTLHAKTFEMMRAEAEAEKELEDCEHFVRRIMKSSANPVLDADYDLECAEVLGMGNYGYVLTCKKRASGETVVMKLQSERWVSVALKEWAHGSCVGVHPHIVQYVDAIIHKDTDEALSSRLKRAFADGTLTGKRPKKFPGSFCCLVIEYMDRGTLQNLMDKDLLTLQCMGAVTRQIASALEFMHTKRRTHNDIKPENVLLRAVPGEDCLHAKLADFGLADHSTDRRRDFELFGYMVWCMGLNEKFVKIPSGDEERARAIDRFKDAGPGGAHGLWQALAATIAGLWQDRLQMHDVEDMEQFRKCEVQVPSGATKGLEESARRSLPQRRPTMTNIWMSAASHPKKLDRIDDAVSD